MRECNAWQSIPGNRGYTFLPAYWDVTQFSYCPYVHIVPTQTNNPFRKVRYYFVKQI